MNYRAIIPMRSFEGAINHCVNFFLSNKLDSVITQTAGSTAIRLLLQLLLLL